jgi:hypothetical protein
MTSGSPDAGRGRAASRTEIAQHRSEAVWGRDDGAQQRYRDADDADPVDQGHACTCSATDTCRAVRHVGIGCDSQWLHAECTGPRYS